MFGQQRHGVFYRLDGEDFCLVQCREYVFTHDDSLRWLAAELHPHEDAGLHACVVTQVREAIANSRGFREGEDEPAHGGIIAERLAMVREHIALYYGRATILCRGVAQLARASGLGPEGREFESRRPDHLLQV